MRKVVILAVSLSLISMACAKKKEEEGVKPTGPVVVGVVKSEGNPVEGAEVVIEALGISATTGADGTFKLTDLIEGSYDLVVRKEGYVAKSISITVGAEGTVNVGEIELSPSGTVAGKVIRGENPAPSIPISVEGEPFSTTTGGDGTFSLELPVGDHVLVVQVGDQVKRIPVTIEKGKVVTLEDIVFEVRGPSDDFSGTKLDPKWTALDIGTSGGDQRIVNGVLRISADGEDIWGTSDQFRFIYQKIEKDFDAQLKIISIPTVHEWSKGGLMVRQDTSPGSPHALIQHNNGHGLTFQTRTNAGGSCNETGEGTLPNLLPVWVRIERKGDTFTAYGSSDGKGWTQIGTPVSIPMVDPVLIGIALTSHISGTVADGEFDDFVVKQ